jgi:hypothetical protein
VAGLFGIRCFLDGKETDIWVSDELPVAKDGDYVFGHGKVASARIGWRTDGPGGSCVDSYFIDTDSRSEAGELTLVRLCFWRLCGAVIAQEGKLWPAIGEKAYATAYGSYATISGGDPGDALSDLTGR